jgi:predicted CopG family antitoxin
MKHIVVKDRTWHKLTKLKEPGETFDDLCNRLMDVEAAARLAEDISNLERAAVSVGTDLEHLYRG